jgi:hypothetical protein
VFHLRGQRVELLGDAAGGYHRGLAVQGARLLFGLGEDEAL